MNEKLLRQIVADNSAGIVAGGQSTDKNQTETKFSAAANGKKRLLIVDDSPTVLQFARKALEDDDEFSIVTTQDMWIAPLVTQHEPDLILMDVNLGTLCNGPVVVKALKKRAFAKSSLVVLYSSLPPNELAEIGRECGADGYIEKTNDPALLRKKIRSVFAGARGFSGEAAGSK